MITALLDFLHADLGRRVEASALESPLLTPDYRAGPRVCSSQSISICSPNGPLRQREYAFEITGVE